MSIRTLLLAVAITIVTASALTPAPATAATSPVTFRLVRSTMGTRPIAQLETVKTSVALQEAGWALHNSDDLHPMVSNVAAGKSARYRLKWLKCGEAALVNPYAVTRSGQFIRGKAVSLFRSCPTHVGAHVNQVCPTGVKKFTRVIRVSDGDRFTWGGMSHLVLADGTILYSRVYLGHRTPSVIRLTYWAGPAARLDTPQLRLSTAFVGPNWGGYVVSDRLTKTCQTSGYAG